MNDLNTLASDLCLYSMPEFGLFELADEITTGSSIMPQKRNPDVLELIRAKSNVMQSYVFQTSSLIQNLFSGYNRDFQLTKEPLIKGLELCESTLKIMGLVLSKIVVNKDKCKMAMSVELYATDHVYELVKKGIPFRDAYKKIAKDINKFEFSRKAFPLRMHTGAAGNLGLNDIKKRTEEAREFVSEEKENFSSALSKLLN